MPGRRPSGRPRLAALGALVATVCLTALGTVLLVPGSAGAATTVKAQLSLTGIATADNPTGGSVLGIHPGDTVTFTPATVPTAGFDKLGLSGLLNSLLGPIVSENVIANFAGLPGGANGTSLTASTPKSFTFARAGTYSFTWSATALNALGLTIQLDGNQLKAAGVKLNAQNQYVGQIVVANNPPKGGIGVQLPGVSIQPTLPIVGTLPKITIPGVSTPTLPVALPNLNPGTTTTPTKTKTPTTGTSTASSVAGVLPVPAMIVPQGNIAPIGGSNNFGVTSGNSDAVPVDTAPIPGTTTSTATSSSAKNAEAPAAKQTTIDAGTYSPTSSGLPVILAVVAMLALVLVAGTYARLFLLRKPD